MKKYINIAFIYAIAAIACGVFYREFTKFHGFTGKSPHDNDHCDCIFIHGSQKKQKHFQISINMQKKSA